MGLRIKAGILVRESSYYGAANALSAKVFQLDNMDNVEFGYLVPSSDSGVGTASSVLSFTQNPLPPSNAIRGIDFDYNHSNNIRKHYFISGSSADYYSISGTQSGTTNVNSLVTLTPISPYTLI